MKTCELCPRTSKTHNIGKESGLCTACEASLRYWADKTPRQLMRRGRQIESFQARMDILMGAVKRPKKRRAA